MKKTITSHPFLFGIGIAVLICGAIIIVETWFPWIDEALGNHRALVEAVYFTAFLFAAWVYGFWRWHRRGAFVFWASVSILLLLHAMGIFLYSRLAHPIRVWQWTILGLLECYAAGFFLGWSTRRFGHGDARSHSRVEGEQNSDTQPSSENSD
jgi:hypothetical protein